jgi:outer membrane protein assembly factor BamB
MSRLFFLKFFWVILLSGCSKKRQTIAQWLGANRDGIYNDTGLLKTWTSEGPKLLWVYETIGKGYGSPVVTDEALYVNGEIDSIGHLFKFDLTGNLLWKTPNGPEFFGNGFSSSFPGVRSTPTVFGRFVYSCSGLGSLACIDALTGNVVWTKHMVNDLGGIMNEFGYCESMLVDEHLIYCFPGGPISNMVALDRFTGNVVWTSKALSDMVGFASPILINLPERNLIVTISKNYLFALDAQNGNLLWTYKDSVKYEGDYCNTPIYTDGFIYGVSGVEKSAGAHKIALSADGISIKEVWRNPDVLNEMGGFVKTGDYIFTTTENRKLICLNSNTGAVADTLKNIQGSLIFADNQLYCYSDNGFVNLIGLNGSKMKLNGKFKIENGDKEHLAHLAIGKGVLYIRHGKAIMAYKI